MLIFSQTMYFIDKYERFAVTVLRLTASQLRRYPQGVGRALSAIEFHLSATKEIVVIGPKRSDLERGVLGKYLPDTVVVLSSEPEADAAAIPLLKDRGMIDGKPTVYVCEDFVCQRPVTTVKELDGLL